METGSRHFCENGDNGMKIEDVGCQVSTTLESATTNLHGSKKATGETPSETLLISSPFHGGRGKGKGKLKEQPMKTLAKRTLERVGSRENIEMAKGGKHARFDTRDLFKRKKQGLKPVSKRTAKKKLDAHSFKELLRKRALRGKRTDLLLRRIDKLSGGEGEFIVSNVSNEVDKGVAETNPSKLKTQRFTVKPGLDSSSVTLSKDGMGFEAGLSLECRGENTGDVQSTQSHLNPEIDKERCIICMLGGKLLCCDGHECNKSFHLSCLVPPFAHAPPGVWHCSWCVQKKLQYSVHAVSEGVESILEAREVESDREIQRQKQFLVKYKGLAHVHNDWIPEKRMEEENPELLAKYKRCQSSRWKTEWTIPDCLLQKRWLCLPKQCNKDWMDLTSSVTTEWLVKWTGLGYEHATWELENSEFMKSPETLKLIEEFESRHKGEKRISRPFEGDKGGEVRLSGGSPGVQNETRSNVNKLREFWLSGRNALVYADQERIGNVILFILSLQDNTLPFLIITTSSSLSIWEAEFSQRKTDINCVVYKGNKDVRASIRSLEFYNEDGCVMFQVLLSPIDAFLEDSRILNGIKWGVLIVDEYHRRRMSSYHKQIKELNAYMKLLIINNSRVKNVRYLHLLFILDSGVDGVEEKASENDSKKDICKLKAKLASFVAFECKPRASRFVEYWVPVQLSNVQLEQYCDALLSSAMLLCSHLKNVSVDSLRKILLMTRKCCDHPYLVDTERSLRASILREFPVSEHLGAEIKMSGKLQLLDKFLFRIKERGLRVLILFQSIGGSGVISIGDILDDFVHERFGKDSYARIDSGEIARAKKQATLDCFNNKESNKFVFLLESRACLSSIKLSSIDVVILFNSDWDPVNDLITLKKITIESQFQELKVFRLYLSRTVEEKILILAKEGHPLDCKLKNITRRTCHTLLRWGALHLLNKLDDFHSGCSSSVSQFNLTFEESLTTDVVTEFSALLPYDGEKRNPSHSIILEVSLGEGAYPRNISLPGEVDLETQSVDDIPLIQRLLHSESTHVFWENLLGGRNPTWKFLSGSSSARTGRRIHDFVGLPDEPKSKEDSGGRKRRTVVHSTFELMCSKPRTKRDRKLHSWGRDCNLASQGFSRASIGTKDLTLEQEARQRNREVTSVIEEAPTSDFRKQPQLHVSTDVPSDECGITITNVTASISVQKNHRTHQYHPSARQAQLPIPPARVDSTGLSSSYLWKPVTVGSLQPSKGMPTGTTETGELIQSMAIVPNGNNSLQASHVPQPDLLQMEMERTQKAVEQAMKIHEDMKLQLKAECQKEMDEIHRKYDTLVKYDEMVFLQKKKYFETHYNKVYMNKLLAQTHARTYEGEEAGLPATEQENVPGFMDELYGFCLQQSAARNVTTTLENFSSHLIHRRGSYGGACELRAPAPHLQHLRPSSTKLPIHQALSNLSVPSCRPGQLTELFKSQLRSNGINRPDIITGLPVIDGFLPMSNELLSQFLIPPKLNSA